MLSLSQVLVVEVITPKQSVPSYSRELLTLLAAIHCTGQYNTEHK